VKTGRYYTCGHEIEMEAGAKKTEIESRKKRKCPPCEKAELASRSKKWW
jgi:hypothetical protein